MPHLLSLLLQNPTTPLDYIQVLGIALAVLLGCASGINTVIAWFTGGVKAREAAVDARLATIEGKQKEDVRDLTSAIEQFIDKEAVETRFKSIESRQDAISKQVLNQHNIWHEHQREFDGLSSRVKQTERELLLLEPMPARVSNLEAKFDTLNERISGIKESLSEMKEGMKENKREILEAIRKQP